MASHRDTSPPHPAPLTPTCPSVPASDDGAVRQDGATTSVGAVADSGSSHQPVAAGIVSSEGSPPRDHTPTQGDAGADEGAPELAVNINGVGTETLWDTPHSLTRTAKTHAIPRHVDNPDDTDDITVLVASQVDVAGGNGSAPNGDDGGDADTFDAFAPAAPLSAPSAAGRSMGLHNSRGGMGIGGGLRSANPRLASNKSFRALAGSRVSARRWRQRAATRVAVRRLGRFVPNIVLQKCLRHARHRDVGRSTASIPSVENFHGCVFIADVSGFSALADKLVRGGNGWTVDDLRARTPKSSQLADHLEAERGAASSRVRRAAREARKLRRRMDTQTDTSAQAAEELQSVLSAYLADLIDLIIASGGDVLRLAGDAILAIFTDDTAPTSARRAVSSDHGAGAGAGAGNSTPRRGADYPDSSASDSQDEQVSVKVVHRAVYCALRGIQQLNGVRVLGHRMRLHFALSTGRLCGYTLGGESGRWQYIVGGPAFRELGDTLDSAPPGCIGVSPSAWRVLRQGIAEEEWFAGSEVAATPSGGVVITMQKSGGGKALAEDSPHIMKLVQKGMASLHHDDDDDSASQSTPRTAPVTPRTPRGDDTSPPPVGPPRVDTSPRPSGDSIEDPRTLSARQSSKRRRAKIAPLAVSPALGRKDSMPDHLMVSAYRAGLGQEMVRGASKWLEDSLRAYIADTVVSRVALADSGWLSGLYRSTAMFVLVNCEEVACAGTPDSLHRLQALFNSLQRVLTSNHNAVVKEFTRDDKGYVLVACFGLPPFFLPRSESHAVMAAMEVIDTLRELGFEGRVGLASGVTFCGAVGSSARQELAVVGQPMVLAARLMGNCRSMSVLTDEATAEEAKVDVDFDELLPVMVKGQKRPVRTFRPCPDRLGGRFDHSMSGSTHVARQLVGRQAERARLLRSVHRLWRGREGGLVMIEGDVGIGKSHLVRSCLKEVEAMGLRTIHAAGSATQAAMPFHAWRHAIHEVLQPHDPKAGAAKAPDSSGGQFSLSSRSDGTIRTPLRRSALVWDSALAEKAVLSVLSPSQRMFAWLLNEVIPVKFSANIGMRELSPGEQAAKRLELLCTIITSASKDMLRDFRCGERLLIVIEYGDYLDPSSVQLLAKILDTEGSLSSLVIWVLTRPLRGEAVAPSNDLKSALDFTSRGSPDVPPVVPPHCDPLAPLTLEQLVAGHRGSSLLSSVRVGPMSLSDMETMLMAVLRHESIDGSVLLMLHGRSGGNPFFALKLADALRRANLLVVHKDGVCRFSPDGDWVTVRVPPTLEVAVVSEVAGNLTAGQQLTLKIASVLGLSFSVDLLSKIHPDPASVGKDIRELVRLRHLVDAGDLDEDLDASDSDLDSSSSDDDDIDRVARMRQRRNATAHLRTVDVDALLPDASGTGATESKQDDWTAPELAPILACRFRLLLVQEVVYNSIPFGQRIHLHTLVARALESKLKEAQVEAAAIVNRVRQRSLTHTGPHDHAPSTPVHFRFDFSDSDEEAKLPVEDLLAKARAPVAVPPVAPPPPRLATASPLPSAPPKKKRGWGLIKSAVKRIVAMEHGDGAGAGRRSSSEKPNKKKALHISDIVERAEANQAARLDASLSIFPQLVHHWCLAQNEVRAIKIAEAAGKAALLQFALREVEQAFPLTSGGAAAGAGAATATPHSGAMSHLDQGTQMLISSLPWVRGVAKATAAMNAVASSVKAAVSNHRTARQRSPAEMSKMSRHASAMQLASMRMPAVSTSLGRGESDLSTISQDLERLMSRSASQPTPLARQRPGSEGSDVLRGQLKPMLVDAGVQTDLGGFIDDASSIESSAGLSSAAGFPPSPDKAVAAALQAARDEPSLGASSVPPSSPLATDIVAAVERGIADGMTRLHSRLASDLASIRQEQTVLRTEVSSLRGSVASSIAGSGTSRARTPLPMRVSVRHRGSGRGRSSASASGDVQAAAGSPTSSRDTSGQLTAGERARLVLENMELRRQLRVLSNRAIAEPPFREAGPDVAGITPVSMTVSSHLRASGRYSAGAGSPLQSARMRHRVDVAGGDDTATPRTPDRPERAASPRSLRSAASAPFLHMHVVRSSSTPHGARDK